MKRATPLIFLICLMLSKPARAQVTLGFPFNGACRVGQYMPVRVTPTDPAALPATITISAEGVMPTTIDRPGAPVIVPVLVLRAPNRERQWTVNGSPAERELDAIAVGADERFILSTRSQTSYRGAVFASPAEWIINIDERTLLETQPAAWSAVDAIVFDDSRSSSLRPEQIEVFLSAGVATSVKSVEPAFRDMGWEPLNKDAWVLRSDGKFPRLDAINPSAYGPSSAWNPSFPLAFRRQVVLLAIIVAIVVLAASLCRVRRWSVALIALTSITVCLLLAVWTQRRTNVFHAGGTIIVLRSDDWGTLRCEDVWTYETAQRPAQRNHVWNPLTFPVFASQRQIDAMNMSLICDANGKPRSFEYDLPRDMRIAFVWRRVTRIDGAPQTPSPQATPVLSPLVSLAKAMYLHQGDAIIQQEESSGDATTALERWPSVVVQRP